ncbi:hypothetical protein ACIA5A_26400 [Micromonospora sp. NPDC051300]|uniref:hypothetical protein n=1 Tax=Micromonospora sp. NPDC051300 TaxID=3364286 RepID=UPI00378A117A
MRKALVRTGSVIAAVSLVVGAFPQVALAAGSSANCTGATCQTSGYGFPGGTVSIDADTGGTGTAIWGINGPNGYKCSTTFSAAGGVRSWVCYNAPKGTLNATVSGPAGPSVVGIRW